TYSYYKLILVHSSTLSNTVVSSGSPSNQSSPGACKPPNTKPTAVNVGIVTDVTNKALTPQPAGSPSVNAAPRAQPPIMPPYFPALRQSDAELQALTKSNLPD